MQMTVTDDLIISAEPMEELLVKVQTWKSEMEKKGLCVKKGPREDKDFVPGINLDLLKKSGKDPCGVCQTGVHVGSQSIFCSGCKC